MRALTRIFADRNCRDCRGGMLIELLLSIALAAAVMPFIFQFQERVVRRAENIAVTRQMSGIQSALERYIAANRENLLKSVGHTITRVELVDLAPFGVSNDLIESYADKYQLRILKNTDRRAGTTLQGVIVFADDEITPLRTREIVELAGGKMGFIDEHRAFGAFGVWHADAVDFGVEPSTGLIGTTNINRDSALYLWRLPSDVAADATMAAPLSLGGHDLINSSFVDASALQFSEILLLGATTARTTTFKNRTTIDTEYKSTSATVSGILSSDAKEMNVKNTFRLNDTGKFSNFSTNDLWVTNLTLSGLSIIDDGKISTLNINDTLDMTTGRIAATTVSVGFTGSITPRLQVSSRIEDSINPSYFWDVTDKTANFLDVSLVELNRMATLVVNAEDGAGTTAAATFGSVASNKNATASDFMNAISEIQKSVRAKYRMLNLE